MNPQTDNQKDQKPDFDFILKPNGEAEHPKKKLDKKVVILIVLAVVTVVIIIIGALMSARNNVVEDGTQTPIAAVSTEEAQPVIKDFLAKVADGNNDGAYQNVYNGGENVFTKEVFINEALPVLNTLKLKECTLAQEDIEENFVVFGCTMKTGETVVNLEFLMTKDSGETKIIYYRLGQSA